MTMKASGSAHQLRQRRNVVVAPTFIPAIRLVPLSLRTCCRLRFVAIVLGSLYCLYMVVVVANVHAFQITSTGSSTFMPPASLTPPFPRLDFLVAGFPKCGTTSLLYSLTAHPEVAIDRREHCAIAMDLKYSEREVAQMFRNDMHALEEKSESDTTNAQAHPHAIAIANAHSKVVTGIKCPDALFKDRAIRRLVEWQTTPDPTATTTTSASLMSTSTTHTHLIIGLRHPVWQIQSYYNYRVTEMYDKKVWWKRIRTLPDILEGRTKPWKGMSPYSVRFELFLQQLDKVPLTKSQLAELQQYPDLSVQPNPFRIFIYALEQLEDAHTDRNAVFRRDLADFLHLHETLPEVGHENQNHFTGAAAHAETINICDAAFDAVRRNMVRDATISARWIGEHFINSPDVTVSNRAHFLEALQGWEKDPCLNVVVAAAKHK